jgi:hypothetical protein
VAIMLKKFSQFTQALAKIVVSDFLAFEFPFCPFGLL